MPIFNDDDFVKNEELMRNVMLSSSLDEPADEEYIKALFTENDDRVLKLTRKENPLSTGYIPPGQRLQQNYQSGVIESQEQNKGSIAQLDAENPTESTMWDTTINETLTADSKENKRVRRDAAYRLGRLQSADKSMQRSSDRWANRDKPLLSPQEAMNYARELGADLKFDRNVSNYEVVQAAETYIKRDNLQNAMAMAQSTGSQGWVNNAAVWASAVAGGTGPIELATTVGVSVLLPYAALGVIGKGAGTIQNVLKVKKAMDATRSVKAAQTANNIAKGALAAAETEEAMAASIMLKGAKAATDITTKEKAILKASQALEKVKGLNYNSLTGVEKTGLDALTFTATDIPFINLKYQDAKDMGFDLYTEQDKAVDTLMAAGLGVVLPGGVRALGNHLGIRPAELTTRKLNNLKIDLETKEALGDITAEEAITAKSAIKNIENNLKEYNKSFTGVHPKIQEMANDLSTANISDETLYAQQVYILGQILNGNSVKLHDMVEFESILSHIDNRVLKQLDTLSPNEVFGSQLIRDTSVNGIWKTSVLKETGLLSKYKVSALSEEEAVEQLGNIYKGTVLQNKEALDSFKEWSQRLENFVQEVDRIRVTAAEQKMANIKEKGSYKRSELIDVKQELRRAYDNYKLGRSPEEALAKEQGDELDEILGISTNQSELDEILGLETAEEVIPSTTDEGFEEFFKKNVTITDKGFFEVKKLGQWVEDMKTAIADNKALAQIDDYVAGWNAERLNNIKDSVMKFDTTVDTTLTELMGIPRVSYRDAQELIQDADKWKQKVTVKKITYNQTINDPTNTDAIRVLKYQTGRDVKLSQAFADADKTLETIDQIRKTDFQDLKTNIITAFKENKSLQKRLKSLVTGDKVNIHGIELAMREIMTKALSDSGLNKLVSHSRDVLDKTVKNLSEELRKNPEKMEAFLRPEDLEDIHKIPEFGLEQDIRKQKVEIEAKNLIDSESILAPLVKGLDIEFSKLELQTMLDREIAINTMSLMMNNPEIAAEVLAGMGTQTQYAFQGARRSVEYLTKTSSAYVGDIKNQLRELHSVSNNAETLLDYFNNEENKPAIMEAFIRKRYGEELADNSDAARVAQIILDSKTTFLSSFQKYGSTFEPPSTVVKRSNLQYIDAAMSNSEVADLEIKKNIFFEKLNTEAFDENLKKYAILGEDGKAYINRGLDQVELNEDLLGEVESAVNEIKRTVSDFFNVDNDIYRKMGLWAFRDFDLDKMVSTANRSNVSYNEVRDAVLNGDWEQFANGDIQKIFEMKQALNNIRTELLGTKSHRSGTVFSPSGVSWVHRFRTGFDDIGAISSGSKNPALDAVQNGIYFKNADTEIQAERLFGYATAEEHIQSEFDRMFHAYYALEKFGTRPGELIDELVDKYNYARQNDAAFADKLKARAEVRSGSDSQKISVEKFAISENAKNSAKEYALLACGLQNAAPAAATTLIKTLSQIFSVELLTRAGFKGLADLGTIWSGLTLNAMAEGRWQSMVTTGKAVKTMIQNRDILDLVLATTVLDADTVLKKMLNDPAADLRRISKSVTTIENLSALAKKWSNVLLNKFGWMSGITNNNKKIAGMSIQMSIGKLGDTDFNSLAKNFKLALLRDDIQAADWNFLRKYAIHDLGTYLKEYEGVDLKGNERRLFIPMALMRIPDKVFEAELVSRGVKNILPETVADFKRTIISKAWNMVDTAADEMVSIPTSRISTILRGGQAPGSVSSALIEVATQFQSFGAQMAYNNYGRQIANAIAEETGVTVLDIFNKDVMMKKGSRSKLYKGLFGTVCTIGLTSLAVNKAIEFVTTGGIKAPVGEDGEVHIDAITRDMVGALGIMGTLIDTITEGVQEGDFNLQVAPSISGPIRRGYRLAKPLTSSSIDDSKRAEAFAAASIQEVARFTGIKTLPQTALTYQLLIGSWLDSIAEGGDRNYNRRMDRMKDKGYYMLPALEDPEPLWERLP